MEKMDDAMQVRCGPGFMRQQKLI